MRVRALGLTFAVAAAAAVAGAQAPASLSGVRIGVSTMPESVTVGDPLVLRVRVSAPAGSAIAFPAGPDTAAQVQAIASRTVVQNAAPGVVDQTAAYTLVAWDVGDVPARLGDVVVTLAGDTRRIPLGDAMVHVKSVLP
ncbi:MAG TPA: hypothetical protein VHM30_09800, partial [Gemmatimonadaceae bacterium]|nr:hypothetical protein [Gemmatimonadaceae bacterium]